MASEIVDETGTVVQFNRDARMQDREAPLTNAELRAIRQLLRDAPQVFNSCPIARRALLPE